MYRDQKATYMYVKITQLSFWESHFEIYQTIYEIRLWNSFAYNLNERPISHAMIVQTESENVFNFKQFSNSPFSYLSPKVQQ